MIIMGFGKTETDYHNKVNKDIEDMFIKIYNENKEDNECGIGEKTFNIFKEEVKKYEETISKEYEEIDKQTDRPERYSKIWIRALCYKYTTVLFRISYTHINTRHPMSPDGIAGWYPKITHGFDLEDLGLSDY